MLIRGCKSSPGWIARWRATEAIAKTRGQQASQGGDLRKRGEGLGGDGGGGGGELRSSDQASILLLHRHRLLLWCCSRGVHIASGCLCVVN